MGSLVERGVVGHAPAAQAEGRELRLAARAERREGEQLARGRHRRQAAVVEEAHAERAPADRVAQPELGGEVEHPVVLERDRVVVAVDLDAADARRAGEPADALRRPRRP